MASDTYRTEPTLDQLLEPRLFFPTTAASFSRVLFGFFALQMFEKFKGNLKSLNELAKTARADYILHTGDFGFYDNTSLERIADK
ncbi:hypothetical protein A1O3_06530 [Capronia epimyces CBS 606.96]|uniref:Calcineurin-like phosphoesterase domain-containing protein n=1 Tax=Capronia epimyces CBS 606.96 TaxID=1182542 RepID=W9Y0F0_9EURO|nr:uncharacterized protein A1O3_06530 [Capronia epimyces CBS 606.96]EXJ82716.1 hypothetical protein A1O3_06530 [Capronia epimyces CBS 606.96]